MAYLTHIRYIYLEELSWKCCKKTIFLFFTFFGGVDLWPRGYYNWPATAPVAPGHYIAARNTQRHVHVIFFFFWFVLFICLFVFSEKPAELHT